MAQPFTREDQLGVSLLTLEQLKEMEAKKIAEQQSQEDQWVIVLFLTFKNKKNVFVSNISHVIENLILAWIKEASPVKKKLILDLLYEWQRRIWYFWVFYTFVIQ